LIFFVISVILQATEIGLTNRGITWLTPIQKNHLIIISIAKTKDMLFVFLYL